MKRKFTDYLKALLFDGRLNLLSSILVFCCSIFVNAYFQVTSFSALTQWFLKISGAENVPERLAEIFARTATPVGMRNAFE